MNNSRRLYSNRRSFFILIMLVTLLMLILPSVVSLSSISQENDRAGDKLLERGDDFRPPVEIILTKSKIGVIRPGKKFSAGDDWFKGLTVTVRNNSERPIIHLSLRLRFPRPQGQEKVLDFVEPLNYGVSPIPDPAGEVHTSPARPVKPGESVEIRLSDEDYIDIKGHLKSIKYPPTIKRIRLSVLMIGFDDGTVWMGGKRYVPDTDNPGD